MRKIISVCFFTFLAFSLILIGVEWGDAQVIIKGKPAGKGKPQEKWRVTIADGGYNLNAFNVDGSNTYTDNDFVYVGFSPPSKQCACYGFRLGINSPADGELGDYAIDFEGVGIDYWSTGEGIPCVLPIVDVSCVGNVDCVPDCIADFVNENPHPSQGYLRASIWIQLKAEYVDSLLHEPSGTAQMPPDSGFISFSFYNGNSAIPENSSETIYHEVYGFTRIFSGVWVTKESNGDKWTIEVMNQPLDLMEQYLEEYAYYRGNKAKTATRLQTPIEVVTSPVNFVMIWEKIQ